MLPLQASVSCPSASNWRLGSDASAWLGEAPADITVDRLTIRNGIIVYRDVERVERVEQLELTAKIASLAGPPAASGSLIAHGVPVKFDIALARIAEGRAEGRVSLEGPEGIRLDLTGEGGLAAEARTDATVA